MVLIEEAILVLLFRVVEIFLQVWYVSQHLIDGSPEALEDLLAHRLYSVLVVESYELWERMVGSRVRIKLLLGDVDKINRHDLVFHQLAYLIRICGQLLPSREV